MVQIAPEPFDSAEAGALSSAYYGELATRFPGGFVPTQGFSASASEFVEPDGEFLIARIGGAPVGCGGLRKLDAKTGEIKHMWVATDWRGRGLARQILAALEETACRLGCERVVLDTSAHLPEAIRLYTTSGYVEIAPYNENRYAQHWFAKQLSA